jgi:hemerythrin-like domain-containing protein
MSRAPSKPDLTFVTLIHQSLRADAARLAASIAELGPSDRQDRLPGIQAFFGHYREQLLMHHRHEDELFFPALAARAGAGRMHLSELAGQHEALDAALQAVGEDLTVLAGPVADFATDRVRAASALSTMAGLLAAHLTLEERTALPLFESDMPAADYKKLEARARKATPRPQAQFLIPWVIAHATPDQRDALFRSAPPLRLAYQLNYRRYRRLDQALARATLAQVRPYAAKET